MKEIPDMTRRLFLASLCLPAVGLVRLPTFESAPKAVPDPFERTTLGEIFSNQDMGGDKLRKALKADSGEWKCLACSFFGCSFDNESVRGVIFDTCWFVNASVFCERFDGFEVDGFTTFNGLVVCVKRPSVVVRIRNGQV